MNVTIFGVTGYTGSNLARELVARGHTVTGVARTLGHTPDGVDLIQGSILDERTISDATKHADAILVAVRHAGDTRELADVLPLLLTSADQQAQRLGIVGGAGSLLTQEGGPRLLDSGFPDAWRPEAEAASRTLDGLRSSGTTADWFYVSPAEVYGAFAPGERRGTYRIGQDVVVRDATGTSTIGGEDLAAAVIDELENPSHHQTRFTLAY